MEWNQLRVIDHNLFEQFLDLLLLLDTLLNLVLFHFLVFVNRDCFKFLDGLKLLRTVMFDGWERDDLAPPCINDRRFA